MERKNWPAPPGSCPPPPRELVCIVVDKIYDACSQRECEEFTFPSLALPSSLVGSLVSQCRIEPGSESYCDWSIEPINGGPLGKVKVTVCANVNISLSDSANAANTATCTETVCFEKEVILYAPDPIHMEVLVESIFESLACSATPIPDGGPIYAVTATVGAFIVVKVSLRVQLLVPAYGFCPTPPECEELGDLCLQFMERPFPPFFPPQLSDLGLAEEQ